MVGTGHVHFAEVAEVVLAHQVLRLSVHVHHVQVVGLEKVLVGAALATRKFKKYSEKN